MYLAKIQHRKSMKYRFIKTISFKDTFSEAKLQILAYKQGKYFMLSLRLFYMLIVHAE